MGNFPKLRICKLSLQAKRITASTNSVHQGAASSPTPKLTENPGEAKVTQLDDLVLGDEDVLRLDVSVNALHQERADQTEISKGEKKKSGNETPTAPPTPTMHVVTLLRPRLFVASL